MPEKILKFIDSDGNEREDALFLNGSIKEFNDFIQTSNYSVYSFTGNWGSGKTTFIKLWEKTLNSSDYIHIDAFEMDYETEPFIMLIKHFYKYLKNEMKIDDKLLNDFTNKAKNIFTRSIKTIGKVGINAITSKLIGNENAKELLANFSEILFDELVITESEESSLYEKLKDVLEQITEGLEKPIYVIIDELDRCRPSFALETLEKIKHIFNVKNIKFILVYNNYILESIIEKTYGISNGNNYLDKFIQKNIIINNMYHFNSWFFQEVTNLKENNHRMQAKLERLESDYNLFSNLVETYDISLRAFQTLFPNLLSYHNIPFKYEGDKELLVIIALEIIKILDNKKYIDMREFIERKGKFDIITQEAPMFSKLLNTLQSSATSQEVTIIYNNYINGEYN